MKTQTQLQEKNLISMDEVQESPVSKNPDKQSDSPKVTKSFAQLEVEAKAQRVGERVACYTGYVTLAAALPFVYNPGAMIARAAVGSLLIGPVAGYVTRKTYVEIKRYDKKSILCDKDVKPDGKMVARDKELRANNSKNAVEKGYVKFVGTDYSLFRGNANAHYNRHLFKVVADEMKDKSSRELEDLMEKIACLGHHELRRQIIMKKKLTSQNMLELSQTLRRIANEKKNITPVKSGLLDTLAEDCLSVSKKLSEIESRPEFNKNYYEDPLYYLGLYYLGKIDKKSIISLKDVNEDGKMVQRDWDLSNNGCEAALKKGFGRFTRTFTELIAGNEDIRYNRFLLCNLDTEQDRQLLGKIAYLSQHELVKQLAIPSRLTSSNMKQTSFDLLFVAQELGDKCPNKVSLLKKLSDVAWDVSENLLKIEQEAPFIKIYRKKKIAMKSFEPLALVMKKSVISTFDVKPVGKMVNRDMDLWRSIVRTDSLSDYGRFTSSINNRKNDSTIISFNNAIIKSIGTSGGHEILKKLAFVSRHELSQQLKMPDMLRAEEMNQLYIDLLVLADSLKNKAPNKADLLATLCDMTREVCECLTKLERKTHEIENEKVERDMSSTSKTENKERAIVPYVKKDLVLA